MDKDILKLSLEHIWEDSSYEEAMGYDPSIYDLFVNVEEGICIYKEKQINLRKSHLEYLKLVIKNSRNNKYTFSEKIKDELNIETKSVDKMKELINKTFKEKFDIELIVNFKGYGNKINSEILQIYAI
ncbi:MAG: hypothetical protein PHV37_01075 [Candidatus Gastranaerophilales bacterium]|nr:hypothetical protein [Candidatus Gastranaerophilales bacterium]